jgi:hypothetical protein
MSSSVTKHLSQIEKGAPVNWKVTNRLLLKAGVAKKQIDEAFSITAYGNDIYQVQIANKELFSEIQSLVSISIASKNSRTSASIMGNTHSVSVCGAMLIVWHAEEGMPAVRVFDDNNPTPVTTKPNILIIENEECFLNKESTYRFARQYCGLTCPIEDIEFVFGSGNSITNKRILPYLKSTTGDVYCLFDIDFGGLRIFANLLAGGLSHKKTHYLVPSDLEKRLNNSKRSASAEELGKLDQVYGLTAKTDEVVSAIRYYNTTLEQESYRAEY